VTSGGTWRGRAVQPSCFWLRRRADPGGADLADALGITTVHLSRTLRRLRDRELVRWADDSIEILNRPELERLAAYERTEGARRPLI